MGDTAAGRAARRFPATLRVGDLRSGTVTEVTKSGTKVRLDGFGAHVTGIVGPLDGPWLRRPAGRTEVGQRIAAEVIALDPDEGRVMLSTAATADRELWLFLRGLRPGAILSGTVASIERFGVFVALDDGPAHPVFPGVGFITFPELSWRRFEDASEVVAVGQRVSCEFLQFDTWNGEARLSLRALQPDPLAAFAVTGRGRTLPGRVTRLLPFGAFVEVADGIEGLVPLDEFAWTPVEAPEEVVQVGDQVPVVVMEVDVQRRRVTLSLRRA